MKRIHIFLPDPQRDELQALSDKTGITASEHVRRAIDEYLKRLKQSVKRSTSTEEKAAR